MTDPLGQSQVLPYLGGLSKQGYQFTLISFEKEERIEKGKAVIEQICRENNIQWCPLMYTKTPPVLSTLKDIRALKRNITSLQSQSRFDLVHCRSYITALAGEWMKKKWGTKFVFDMRGFWADERVDGKIWNLKNPLFKMVYNYFKKKEKDFLSKADHIISLTHNAKQVIHSWKEVSNQPVPIQVIPCCVDLVLFEPATIQNGSIDQLKKELGIPAGVEVISYIGSIGTWYMLPEMLDFFKQWLFKKPGSVLLFVTNDNSDHILMAAGKAGIAAASIRIKPAARTEVPLFIAACDYSLFFIKPVFSKRASSPTKQGEIMAMGKPVICNSNVGDTDYVVKQYHSGVLINDFSNTDYNKAIEEVTIKGHFNAVTIREGARQFFSLEEGVRRYAEVYRTVLNEQ
jgi:glycosyltransferase involved in cell wall biosynthesis